MMKSFCRAMALLAPLLLTVAFGPNSPASDADSADGASTTAASTTASTSTAMLTTTADLNGKRIGVQLGSVYDGFATKTYPDATVLTFDSGADLRQAVQSSKVDAALSDEEGIVEALTTNTELAMFGEPVLRLPLGAGFRKDSTA